MRKRLHALAMKAWAFALIWGAPAVAESACEPWAAKLVSAQGRVEVKQVGQVAWEPVAVGHLLCDGDRIRVDQNARAAVQLPSETILRLDQDTTLTFTASTRREHSLLELLRGAIHAISRVPRVLEVRTPFVNAAVEGTEFFVRATAEEAQVTVFEGRVRMENSAGQLRLARGESGSARVAQAPVSRVIVDPSEEVKWAVFFPPVADLAGADGPEAIREASARFAAGDIAGALAAMSATPTSTLDADFFAYRASLLLYVGRVDEAEETIASALAIAPKHGVAMALKSVVALSQNQAEEALRLAQEASQRAPDSAAPRIALSYAEQARFNLETALRQAEAAAERAPEDALARARVAELRLALGNLKSAEAAAEAAVQLNPNLARTQTVLGFANLLRLRPDRARERFEQAIALDSADPLPRLGLGLARIRKGDLAEGRGEIEIAAGLDPRSSIVRSYLGKAYYEERRGDLAGVEFEHAKEYDPQDPTPWLYDAIRKQTENRPVEALQDLQRSIELNDNRAVYRSRLLLDQDLASRSASMGRIFTDLGFEQIGLTQGWTSVNTDPGDYSGHRLLADLYRALPRHEIARASELLQSQLLQPLNMTPLQPQLAETDLLLLDSSGPSSLSFQEFNPLFTRDGASIQTSGAVGNNATWGDDFIVSGIHGGLSGSLGQFHLESDGFKEDADVQHDVYNVFVQGAVNPSLNLQAEYRQRTTDQGDLTLNFDPSIVPSERREVDQETLRIGARYSLSPGSTFLFSGIYTDRESEVRQMFGDLLPIPNFNLVGENSSDGYQAEARYLFRHDAFQATAGGGIYDVDSSTLLFSEPGGLLDRVDINTDHANAYLYTGFAWPRSANWTLGLSYDALDEDGLDKDELSPKIGLQWDLTSNAKLRTAYFRTLKRALAVDQTIEPTQVAGFNQFFDDVNGTKTERYGIGLDLTLTRDLYAGIEYSHRDLDVPEREGQRITNLEREEDVARAYLYWALHPRWSFSSNVELEHFERSPEEATVKLSGAPSEVNTLILPVAASYFHPSGIFAKIGGTFVRQEVDLPPTSSLTKDDDDFFLVDAAVGYRLPRRFGIVSLGVRNLLDESFSYQDLNVQTSGESVTPRFVPERTLLFRATIALD